MKSSEILNKINDLLADVETLNEDEEELKANLLHRIDALKDSKSGFEDCWDELHDNFQWEMVQSAMAHLDWKYYNEGTPKVPNVKTLKETARRLTESAWRNRNILHGTGGFKVTVDSYGRATLEFVLTDWETEEYGTPKL